MAGITAAQTLSTHGVTNFLILEGKDRIGGRLKDMDFEGIRMEVGAQWITGIGSNPM